MLDQDTARALLPLADDRQVRLALLDDRQQRAAASAASDHGFGPLPITSTNRTARSSQRSRPLGGSRSTASRPSGGGGAKRAGKAPSLPQLVRIPDGWIYHDPILKDWRLEIRQAPSLRRERWFPGAGGRR